MKKLAGLALTTTMLLSQFSYAGDVAVINIEQLFMESVAGKDLQAKLAAKKSKLDTLVATEEKKLQETLKDFEKQKSVLSEAALGKKQKEIEENINKKQAEIEAMRNDLGKAQSEGAKQIEDASRKVMAELAKQKNYKTVLPTGVVPYFSPEIEITKDTIDGINKEIKAVKIN